MNEPRALVEHFFRHEFGRLCAVLTRSLGVGTGSTSSRTSSKPRSCRFSGIQGRVASGTMNEKWGARLLTDFWSAVIS